jgi:hypothetical protein
MQWILVNRLIGSLVNWGKSWKPKTNREYNQNLLRLFGAPCHLIGPVATTWRACDHYVINASLSVIEHLATAALSLEVSALVVGGVACAAIFSFKILDP